MLVHFNVFITIVASLNFGICAGDNSAAAAAAATGTFLCLSNIHAAKSHHGLASLHKAGPLFCYADAIAAVLMC